ncbi:AMP-binding protein [Oricola sp.]|uniref:AMP-binding protein n=1 Tax=Oricola sp. TaxID=1979950 RepID=UPI0025FD03AF|nr:AMP-binding protein [Oricola sp.]MCI5074132.1 AMP-binding protein [Oricola sp.]
MDRPTRGDTRNVNDLLEATVRRLPDQIAFETDAGDLTYAQFGALVDRIASGLLRLGAKTSDRVAAKVGKSVDSIALFYAALKVGVIYVPVNPGFTDEETRWIVSDAEPLLVIADDPDDLDRMANATGGGGPLAVSLRPCDGHDAILTDGQEHATPPPTAAAEAAAMLYTSGTTGRPKGAIMSHEGIINTFTFINRSWEIGSADRLLHVLPTYHAHGLIMATACPIFAGATIMLMPKFDIDRMIARLPDATVVMAVPTIYRRLLDHPDFTREACRNLRLLSCGSAPLSMELFDEVLGRTGLPVVERYASTESGLIAANPLKAPRRGSVGKIPEGVEMRLADENGEPVETGTVGRIQARGVNVFLGYWKREDLAASSMTPDGYFDTGDLGRLDDDGYLYIVGRDKEVIISGGYNVYPREVELALEQIEGVAEAAVYGVEHPDYGEAVVAAVRVTDPFLDEETMLAAVKGHLASYKCPKKIVAVPEIPRNDLGKILKTELKTSGLISFSL